MEVPDRILINLSPNGGPSGYYGLREEEDDYDDDMGLKANNQVDPNARILAPPETLTATDIIKEEKRRLIHDTSIGSVIASQLNEESIYGTHSDTLLKGISSDPIGIARQVRHLHNRVRLLEEELQAQYNRQVLLIGFVSVYMISRCIRWMYK